MYALVCPRIISWLVNLVCVVVKSTNNSSIGASTIANAITSILLGYSTIFSTTYWVSHTWIGDNTRSRRIFKDSYMIFSALPSFGLQQKLHSHPQLLVEFAKQPFPYLIWYSSSLDLV